MDIVHKHARFEQLLVRLAKNKNIKLLLEETANLPADDLIRSLLNEFEQVVERYKNLSVFAGEAHQISKRHISGQSSAPPDVVHSTPIQDEPRPSQAKKERAKTYPLKPLRIEPIKVELPAMDLQELPRSVETRLDEGEKKQRLRKELESIERKIYNEVRRDWETRTNEIQNRIGRLKTSRQLLQKQLDVINDPHEVPVAAKEKMSLPVEAHQVREEIADDDVLYLHALVLPGDAAGDGKVLQLPVLKGMDGKSTVFAFDLGGQKVLLSKIRPDYFTITKSGIMLLGKQESLQLRCRHEETLNHLRTQNIVPFAFGTLARGWDELVAKMRLCAERAKSTADHESPTAAWSLRLFVLDARVAEITASRTPVVQRKERGRSTKTKRFDVKLLEKMLQMEKKAAETIHKTLSVSASKSSVHSMISIANGRSEDWKLILHATYEPDETNKATFLSSICALQEEYRKMGLMFCLDGSEGRIDLTGDFIDSQTASA